MPLIMEKVDWAVPQRIKPWITLQVTLQSYCKHVLFWQHFCLPMETSGTPYLAYHFRGWSDTPLGSGMMVCGHNTWLRNQVQFNTSFSKLQSQWICAVPGIGRNIFKTEPVTCLVFSLLLNPLPVTLQVMWFAAGETTKGNALGLLREVCYCHCFLYLQARQTNLTQECAVPGYMVRLCLEHTLN